MRSRLLDAFLLGIIGASIIRFALGPAVSGRVALVVFFGFALTDFLASRGDKP